MPPAPLRYHVFSARVSTLPRDPTAPTAAANLDISSTPALRRSSLEHARQAHMTLPPPKRLSTGQSGRAR
eukprot:1135477-Pleurochrysis_carterae.AAC.2